MSQETIFAIMDSVWDDLGSAQVDANVIKLKNISSTLRYRGENGLAQMAERSGRALDQAIYGMAVQLIRISVNSSHHDGLRLAAMETLGVLSEKGLPRKRGFEIGLEELSRNDGSSLIKVRVVRLLQAIKNGPDRVYRRQYSLTAGSPSPE